ncbi:restriction endonuclease subunit S [Halosquirtibacter xylanolyticus]|uniref:restriction endonuclease subunit S n=1 Tax=Halosquirtibacter xylanolyticus TaxID=3374599 RepID=UPI003747CBC6|nr:restriction endonuclease subunit S [Prolixibacteraceae bacterium]
MNKWIKLKDVVIFNRKSYKKNEIPTFVKYLDTGSLTKNKITKLQYIDTRTQVLPSRAQRKISKYSILYSTVRPVQEHYGFFESEITNLVVSTGFITIDIIDDSIFPKYIYYLLCQNYVTNFLQNVGENSVSSYPSISPHDLGNLRFKVPQNILIQKKIAKVLSDLDSKIELNNKINLQLEEMAKTIYDYWFVQFDFPISKEIALEMGDPSLEGKPYKSSGGKMIFNKDLNREIPQNWSVVELSDIAEITMGQSPSGTSYNENNEGIIFFQGSTDFGWRFPAIRQFTNNPKRFAKQGDILLSVRAPVGDINIANHNCCIGRGLAALRSKENYNSYLFYVMKYFKNIFDSRNKIGTTFGAITKDDLFSLKLVYPSKTELIAYDNIVKNHNTSIFNNDQQNRQLTKLRDWLLPMLMNGQVSAEDIPID